MAERPINGASGNLTLSSMERITTGVPGLDEITGGGLPGPRLYLVRGAAGTGKTTLALQFLLEGVRRGDPVLYVSLAQTEEELRQIADSYGWSLDGVTIQSLVKGPTASQLSEQTIFQSAELRLDQTRDAVEKLVEEISPKRIVYDSLLEVRLLANEDFRFHREVLGFKSFLGERNVTTLLLDTEHRNVYRSEDQLENISHGLIRLEKELPAYGPVRRRVELVKMRGTPIRDGYHDMTIRAGDGVTIFPRIVPEIRPSEAGSQELIKSSIDELDDMLGGGLDSGTTVLVIGQSGTGKSTLASLYARAALARGEGVAMFLFEERQETLFRRSEGLGIDLRQYHKDGRLLLRDFNPVEVSPGEFAGIVRRSVDENDVRVVVIDSLTGYLSALPGSQESTTQMYSLLKYLARRDVLTMLIVAQHGLLGHQQGSDLDVSFLGDTVLLLRMYEWPGLIRRTVTAVKKRHGPHDLEVHELVISDKDVTVRPFNPPPPGDSGPLASGG